MKKLINIPDEIHQWYEEQSNSMAMPISALINFALKNYIDQQKAVVGIEQVIKELQEFKKISLEKDS